MKILVTGGAGFVGSHLCDTLVSDGHDVTVYTRNITKTKNLSQVFKKIKIESVDVTNSILLRQKILELKPDVIFHLAGQTSHKISFDDPFYDLDANTKSTLTILETIREFNYKCKFILGSTFVVIGKPQSLPVTEETSCNPTSIYGANRLTSEHYCKIFNQLYNLDTVIFRITNSFGPREQLIPTKNAINYLIHQAYLGNELTIYNQGNFFRDVIYIDDVISALIILMNNAKSGNLYWISSNTKTWFSEIGQILKENTNGVVNYGEASEYNKKVDVGNFLVENTKLRKLGWKPSISTKDGILKTLEYFSSLENF